MAGINSTATTPEQLAHQPHIEACRNLFGEHPEDVISPINSASDTLLQLVEIFNTISSEALKERNGYRIKYLAEAGSHLAHDMGNYTDCVYGTMIDRLRALAMNARSLTYTVSESMEGDSDELNAVRRVLKLLEDKALEFANQADEFLMSLPDTQTAWKSEAHHG